MKTPRTICSFASSSRKLTAFLLMIFALLVGKRAGAVGSWIGSINAPAGVAIEQMLLLSDGTVMCQDSSSGETNWYKLTPNNGSYLSGSWKQLTSMHYARNAYGKLLLRDGRAMMVGDENDHNGATAEIYDPFTDNWTNLPQATVGFADCETSILPNGDVLTAPVGWLPHPAYINAIYSVANNSWSYPVSSFLYQNECSWVMLPDSSILTIDDNTNLSERFIPGLTNWVHDGTLPVTTWSNGETGAGFLLANGQAFYLGASGHTVVYTRSSLGGTNAGSWSRGPEIPSGRVTCDAPAAMMVNGKVLCAVTSSSTNGGGPAPTWFYEYNNADHTSGTNGTFAATSSPGNPTVGSSTNVGSESLSLLVLPDGTVLYCCYGRNTLWFYQPDASPLAAGKPTIASISPNGDGSFHLTGTLLNGISSGAAFGDESQDASNYPLVRMTNNSTGAIYYGRTLNWSSTGVATGSATVSTEFFFPTSAPPGSYSIVVVANGNPSNPFTYNGPIWVDFNYTGATQNGAYATPYPTIAQGISAVPVGGTIIIKSAGHSAETPTITKQLTISAYNGPGSIGF